MKSDTDFKGSVKGDKGDPGKDGAPGPEGKEGPRGPAGISPDVGQVVQKLVTDKKDELGKAVLEAKDDENREILVTKVAGNQGLQNAVATNLKGDRNFTDSVKGDPGQDGESPSADAVATQLLIPIPITQKADGQ